MLMRKVYWDFIAADGKSYFNRTSDNILTSIIRRIIKWRRNGFAIPSLAF